MAIVEKRFKNQTQVLETRQGVNLTTPPPPAVLLLLARKKVCAAFLTETSPKLYIYELVIHKLAV